MPMVMAAVRTLTIYKIVVIMTLPPSTQWRCAAFAIVETAAVAVAATTAKTLTTALQMKLTKTAIGTLAMKEIVAMVTLPSSNQ